MAPFGIKGKKEVQTASPPATTPVKEVMAMRNRGLTSNQVIQNLQREGYKTPQIVDAMNQAELQAAGPIEGVVPPDMAAPEPEPYAEMPAQEAPEMAEAGDVGYDERIEEIAEAIIDEKWEELVKQVNRVVEWKKEMESRMQTVEARFNDLKAGFETLQKGVVQKVEDYDRNITSVGTEIKAMELVFKKVLPQLTDNVNELSRLTKGMKK